MRKLIFLGLATCLFSCSQPAPQVDNSDVIGAAYKAGWIAGYNAAKSGKTKFQLGIDSSLFINNVGRRSHINVTH